MALKKEQLNNEEILKDDLKMKRLFNYLTAELDEKLSLTEEEKEIEFVAMALAGSETSSIYLITIILVLGILPDIQVGLLLPPN